jgi:aryl-alcohol dehydrogenase-like predicted oxidoreductase
MHQLQGSLKRLKMDCFDLYQVHLWDYATQSRRQSSVRDERYFGINVSLVADDTVVGTIVARHLQAGKTRQVDLAKRSD